MHAFTNRFVGRGMRTTAATSLLLLSHTPRGPSAAAQVSLSLSLSFSRCFSSSSFSPTAPVFTTSPAAERIEPEMITIDVIEVDTAHNDATNSGQADTTGRASHNRVDGESEGDGQYEGRREPAAAASGALPAERWHHELRNAAFWDVVKVDPFARSRVTNFIRRAGSAAQQLFHVREDVVSGHRVHIATCRLTLPEPHRSYIAEGVAENAKDAELLAAMHAERVCDALGVPLFRLPSMQRRHAEAARAEGRYAPMPEDPVRPDGTRIPPPLRMVPGLRYATPSPTVTGISAGSPGEGEAATGLTHAQTQAAAPSQPAGPHARRQPTHTPLFTTSIAEAELVDAPPQQATDMAAASPLSLFAEPHTWPASAATSRLSASVGSCSAGTGHPLQPPQQPDERHQRYRESVWLPWAEAARHSPLSSSAEGGPPSVNGMGIASLSAWAPSASFPPPQAPADVATFDPTENGYWAMVITASTRCSPAPLDALVLPCVYEPAAWDRLKDHFLQRGLPWREQLAMSSAAVPGSPTRMFVAELRLPRGGGGGGGGGVLSAKGKAQTAEVATVLAAMHAELLLDALGLPLFPADDARQARHARAAAGFGRWAPNPQSGDVHVPASVQDAPLPRPLKQQIGGDAVWLDPALILKANAYTRSDGERIISAMNDLNFYCGDCVEVNPPEEWLAESVDILRQWQTRIAGNPFPELYVITVMGDYYRATTLTPVPRAFGVRGGNAIGRSISQAVQLCAMHAVDSLCALGIPLFADPAEQERFLAKRRLCGRVTEADMKGMTRPPGLISVLKPSIVLSREEGRGAAEEEAGDPVVRGLEKPPHVQESTRAYLPGYLIEGSAQRLPPHIKDTLSILQLRIPEDFAICGEQKAHPSGGVPDVAGQNRAEGPEKPQPQQQPGWGTITATRSASPPSPPPAEAAAASVRQSPTAAELLQAYGNDAKVCVQNYLREQHAIRRASRGPAHAHAPTMGASHDPSGPLSELEEKQLVKWLAEYPVNVLPSVYITGYGKQVSVHNIAYLRLPRPIHAVKTGNAAATGSHEESLPPRRKRRGSTATSAEEATSAGEAAASSSTSSPSTHARWQQPPSPAAAPPTLEEPLLAVGISLKKKDAERACYVHAAALLKHHFGEDVLKKYRAGLPRLGSAASFDEVEAKLLPSGYVTAASAAAAHGPPPPPPKPLMNVLMQQFMESGRHFTAPRKRAAPGPFNPF